MSIARFFDRTAEAILHVADIANPDILEQRLSATGVNVIAGDHAEDDQARSEGFKFAVDLAARLYPTMGLGGPAPLVEEAADRAQRINPAIDITEPNPTAPTLGYERAYDGENVTASASGWTIAIDGAPEPAATAQGAASLAAAAVGVSELFREVFADSLPHARSAAEPTSWNLVTLETESESLPSSKGTDVGRVHLAGCGAIGQAAVATLRASDVAGTLVAVDHEPIDLTNLQRYVLTDDSSEGLAKVDVIESALAGTAMSVEPIEAQWSASLAADANCVLAAVDTAAVRIAIQAGLPERLYNAYTDQLDVGWSRHDAFGKAACLACLYWPTGPTRSRAEQIADSLGEKPGRIVGYLLYGTPIGQPLPHTLRPTRGTPPEEFAHWLQTPLSDDLAERGGFEKAKIDPWGSRTIEDLYREAVCGTALMELADIAGRHRQVTVPLAHQSSLAGVMLATQLIVASNEGLNHRRATANEGRIDMLQSPLPYATQRSRTQFCLCSDSDFVEEHRKRWESERTA